MWVSNTFGWSVTSRHNLLLCSMFTRLVVGRGLLRPFFFDDMFEPKTKKRELDSESTQTRSKFQEKNIRVLSLPLPLSLSLSLPLNSVSVNSTKKTRRRRHEEAQKKTRQPPKISSSSLRQCPSKRVFDPRRVRHKKCAVFVTRGRRVRRRRRRRLYSNKAQSLGRTTPKKIKNLTRP